MKQINAAKLSALMSASLYQFGGNLRVDEASLREYSSIEAWEKVLNQALVPHYTEASDANRKVVEIDVNPSGGLIHIGIDLTPLQGTSLKDTTRSAHISVYEEVPGGPLKLDSIYFGGRDWAGTGSWIRYFGAQVNNVFPEHRGYMSFEHNPLHFQKADTAKMLMTLGLLTADTETPLFDERSTKVLKHLAVMLVTL